MAMAAGNATRDKSNGTVLWAMRSSWLLGMATRGGNEKTKTVDAKNVMKVDMKLMRRPTFWRQRRDGLDYTLCIDGGVYMT